MRILRLLSEEVKKGPLVWGVHRSLIQEAMKIPDRNLDSSIAYLARSGMVKLVTAHSADWIWAKITSVGMDVLENPTHYEDRFPFVSLVRKKAGKSRKSPDA